MAPLLLAVPFGQSLAWKRGDLLGAAQRLLVALGLAVIMMVALLVAHRGGPVLGAPRGRARPLPDPRLDQRDGDAVLAGGFLALRLAVRRAAGLPRQAYGSAIAHAGLGLTVIGIAATAWHVETITLMHLGDSRNVGGYTLTLAKLSPLRGPNYRETAASFSVTQAGVPIGDVVSTKRIYTVRGTPTTQVGLMTLGLSQIYASLGDSGADDSIGVRLYWKPLVLLIWLGAIAMAAGGALSLSDRRLRLGLPVRARAVTTEAPAAPAE